MQMILIECHSMRIIPIGRKNCADRFQAACTYAFEILATGVLQNKYSDLITLRLYTYQKIIRNLCKHLSMLHGILHKKEILVGSFIECEIVISLFTSEIMQSLQSKSKYIYSNKRETKRFCIVYIFLPPYLCDFVSDIPTDN